MTNETISTINIQSLPREILALIFSLLEYNDLLNKRLVSKLWDLIFISYLENAMEVYPAQERFFTKYLQFVPIMTCYLEERGKSKKSIIKIFSKKDNQSSSANWQGFLSFYQEFDKSKNIFNEFKEAIIIGNLPKTIAILQAKKVKVDENLGDHAHKNIKLHKITPLLLASLSGHVEIVKELLRRGANVFSNFKAHHRLMFFIKDNPSLDFLALVYCHNSIIALINLAYVENRIKNNDTQYNIYFKTAFNKDIKITMSYLITTLKTKKGFYFTFDDKQIAEFEKIASYYNVKKEDYSLKTESTSAIAHNI